MTTVFVGHDGESKKQINVLNRCISVINSGYMYETDVRQSEMLVSRSALEPTLLAPELIFWDADGHANWASNASDGRSISGEVLMYGSQCVSEQEQNEIAHCAEFGCVRAVCFFAQASAEAMEFQSVIWESWSTVVHREASEAVGVTQPQSVGRLRHVDCIFLFVLRLTAQKVEQCAKVPGIIQRMICSRGLNDELIMMHVSEMDGR